LDKVNYEAVQKNLTTDFLRLALTHREEVTKLLEGQEALVHCMQTEMEAVTQPVVHAEPMGATKGPEEDNDEETADEQEPSILHVLNED
jgi:hypothetical protein